VEEVVVPDGVELRGGDMEDSTDGKARTLNVSVYIAARAERTVSRWSICSQRPKECRQPPGGSYNKENPKTV